MNKIAIHSVPRSGSTWLGEIFNSSKSVAYRFQPLFSFEFKSRIGKNSTKNQIDDFFFDIEKSNSAFLLQSEARRLGKLPRWSKSDQINHIVYKEVRYHHILANMLNSCPDVKVIGLIRNPIAVIDSWLKAPKEFRKDLGWVEAEEWRLATKKNEAKKEEFNGFQKWKEVSLMFEDLQIRYPNQFKIVSYEKLVKHPLDTVRDLFEFCDLEFGKSTIDFLKRDVVKIDKDAYSVNKIRNNSNLLQSSLDIKIQESIRKDLEGTILKKYLL